MATPLIPIEIETDRLVLRRPSVEDAAVQREMWTERDPRVPPHRRIGPDGRPTVEDIAATLRPERESPKTGLLTIVRKHEGDVIGYCGLIFDGRGPSDEPELAYELLRRAQGSATPSKRLGACSNGQPGSGTAGCGPASANGTVHRCAFCTSWPFVDTGKDELDADYGDSSVSVRTFPDAVQ